MQYLLITVANASKDVCCTCGCFPEGHIKSEGWTSWDHHVDQHREAGDKCNYPWEINDDEAKRLTKEFWETLRTNGVD